MYKSTCSSSHRLHRREKNDVKLLCFCPELCLCCTAGLFPAGGPLLASPGTAASAGAGAARAGAGAEAAGGLGLGAAARARFAPPTRALGGLALAAPSLCVVFDAGGAAAAGWAAAAGADDAELELLAFLAALALRPFRGA